MKNELLSLVRETKELVEKQLPKERKKKSAAPLPPLAPLKPKPPPKTPPPAAPTLQPSQPKPEPKQDMGIRQVIEKHLPHLQLSNEIPMPKAKPLVAILVLDRSDLPFLKSLAEAIQNKLADVKLIDGAKLLKDGKWNSFFEGKTYLCVLTPKTEEVIPFPTLTLLPSKDYSDTPEEKKKLWTTLCQKLSPKSS